MQLDTPAVSAATTTARGGAHLHHGIWDQSHNAGPKCICRKSNVMETEEMKTREERHAMDTVKIRELRGTDLQHRARSGRPLAITNPGP